VIRNTFKLKSEPVAKDSLVLSQISNNLIIPDIKADNPKKIVTIPKMYLSSFEPK
jgi:hypothetical protein